MLQSTKDKTFMSYPLCLQAGSFFIGEKMKIIFLYPLAGELCFSKCIIFNYIEINANKLYFSLSNAIFSNNTFTRLSPKQAN